jgi:hypothetical protein
MDMLRMLPAHIRKAGAIAMRAVLTVLISLTFRGGLRQGSAESRGRASEARLSPARPCR